MPTVGQRDRLRNIAESSQITHGLTDHGWTVLNGNGQAECAQHLPLRHRKVLFPKCPVCLVKTLVDGPVKYQPGMLLDVDAKKLTVPDGLWQPQGDKPGI